MSKSPKGHGWRAPNAIHVGPLTRHVAAILQNMCYAQLIDKSPDSCVINPLAQNRQRHIFYMPLFFWWKRKNNLNFLIRKPEPLLKDDKKTVLGWLDRYKL